MAEIKEPQSKEEFISEFKAMKLELSEIKEFMGNIMEAVKTKEEAKPVKSKNWIDEFFGED